MRAIRDLPGRLRSGREHRPTVSVAVITYNHGPFITQALETVLNQKTTFETEIVVGDDYSTDDTREILQSYADRYPGRIRLLLHPERLGPDLPGLHGKRNFLATYDACRGDYVALLEGDDYWTDEYKLQKQVTFLETHQDCSLCSHAVAVEYSGARGQHWGPMIGESTERIISIEEFLRQETQISTPSMLFRRRLLPKLPAWFAEEVNGDYALQALLAERGNVAILPDFMAAHRKHESGLSRLYDENPDFYNAAFSDLLVTLNKHFRYRYRSILKPQIETLQRALTATDVRSFAWSGEPTDDPICVSLDDLVLNVGQITPGPDGRVAIVTHPAAWQYAATLPLPTGEVRAGRNRPAYVRIVARSEGGTIGFGVLERNSDDYLDRCSLEPSEGETEIRLAIPRLKDAGDLVVQTWSRAESGIAHIESIELVVFSESPKTHRTRVLSRRGR